MYNIIPLVIICVSLLVILVIVVRKFPALANLDVDNIPAEKEARFKERIVESRLHRFLAKWRVRLFRVFSFLGAKSAQAFKWLFDRLSDMKKSYVAEKTPATVEEKTEKVKALFMEGEDLDDKDDLEEKEKVLIKIIELEPRNSEAFKDLGELYFSNKKFEDAKQAWGHSLKLLGESETDRQAELYYNLALLYKETADNESALETIKMAAKVSPNNPRYLDALVEISIMNKDKVSAFEALEKLAEVNPENGKLKDFGEQIEALPESDEKA
jgi:tetratricopeptide (TPR) repeat protein